METTIRIDENKLTSITPQGFNSILERKGNSFKIVFKTQGVTMPEKAFEMVKYKQKVILGLDNVSEIYTEEMGRHWIIFLKSNKPVEISQ